MGRGHHSSVQKHGENSLRLLLLILKALQQRVKRALYPWRPLTCDASTDVSANCSHKMNREVVSMISP
ncbi:hypothetical protein PHMEG_0007175 [Phytophthora megakarya]|uniref:Uncharacterized protein n=1 Tax=Phytophthora megakarya TaxID=4795 RepID=A0A225WM07_9STRA|nr:hypothetical protein PHMEG_0007175 [Phytophthora megakarya]